MRILIVVALCCSFFSSRATPLPFEISDCNDPDVFKAVDTALKKYNGDRATGNQFALHVVMEAMRTVSRLCKKKPKKQTLDLCMHSESDYLHLVCKRASMTAKCLPKAF